MKTIRIAFVCVLLIAFASTGLSQEAELKNRPGYVDLEDIVIPESAEELVDITLGPAIFRFARRVTDDDEMEHFSGIFSIRVKAFEGVPSDVEKIMPVIDRIEAKLKNEKWEHLVRVRSEDEYVNINMLFENDKIVGLMLVAVDADDSEVALVNITGEDIKMSRLGHIGLGKHGCGLGDLFSHWDWDWD